MTPARFRPARILALLLVGPLFLAVLALLAFLHFKLAKSGISGWISESFGYRPIRVFGINYALRVLVPVYLVGGIFAWVTSLLPGLLTRRAWLRDWTPGEVLAFGASALAWMHVLLWWEVPSTLWLLPGLRAVPFIVLLPLLTTAALAYPVRWLFSHREAGLWRGGATLAGWLLLWSMIPLAPRWIPRPSPAAKGGTQPCQVLMLGVDGLRSDTFLKQAEALKGTRYANAYTVIPATRLLWHILWGGDPLTYTIGHVGPSVEEFDRPHELDLLRAALEKGWKPRFYIDDGGTIGIAGRNMDLDDALMPAVGWENFINSNLAANFPLYAVWENWFKPFPTTNPWAPLDAGLREALRLGRGSGWVMFHSCLAHQPIFLSRAELAETGRWWTLAPRDYEPRPHIGLVTPRDLQKADPRCNPFRTYEIRMANILRSWAPIWNGLAQDPDYKGATRSLFSDHGERFHNVADGFQLQGVHGFSLDPWECRVAMLMAGPGFPDQAQPRNATVSLMGFRDGIGRLLSGRGPFDAGYLESCRPQAPIRYHTLATSAFGQESLEFRAESEKGLAANTYLAPDGVWFTRYTKSTGERAKDASVAYGEGPDLFVSKPLKGGGAKAFHYRGYDLMSITDQTEEEFQRVKKRVEAMLVAPPLR